VIEGDSALAAQHRALRRRILFGAVVVVGFLWALWRSWDLDPDLFWELLLGTLLFVLVCGGLGALLGLALATLRRWRDR
jgi:hypothetical protein